MASFTERNWESFMNALAIDAQNLELASPEQLNDENVIYQAAKARENGHLALKYASDRLKYDERFVKQVLAFNGLGLQYLPAEMRKNPDIVNVAVAQNPLALAYADKSLLANTRFMNQQIKTHSRAGIDLFSAVTPEMWKDEEFVELAMNNTKSIDNYVSQIAMHHKNNERIMSKLVEANFENVKYASPELKATTFKEDVERYEAFNGLLNGKLTLKQLDKKYLSDEKFFDKVEAEYNNQLEEKANKDLDADEKLVIARMTGYISKAKTNEKIMKVKQALEAGKQKVVQLINKFMADKKNEENKSVEEDLSK